MPKLGRPFTYRAEEERPVTLSLRVPRTLAERLKRYAAEHRQSVSELILEGIEWRLDTPADPRDLQTSDDNNTVIQQLQGMVDAAVEAALARERTLAPPRELPTLAPAPAASMSELSHDGNITVIQEKDAAPTDAPEALETQIDQHISRLEHRIHEIQHDDNDTVIQEPLVEEAVTPPDAIQYYYNNTVIQEETVQASDTEGAPGQTAIPPYDSRKYRLGKLCDSGHEWGTTGQSLRVNNKARYCYQCNLALKRARYQDQKRSPQPA